MSKINNGIKNPPRYNLKNTVGNHDLAKIFVGTLFIFNMTVIFQAYGPKMQKGELLIIYFYLKLIEIK